MKVDRILTWFLKFFVGHRLLWTSLCLLNALWRIRHIEYFSLRRPDLARLWLAICWRSFFEIVSSEQKSEKYKLFQDLRICKCIENHDCESKRFFRKHCGQHPVILLDFAQLSVQSYSEFLMSLRRMIGQEFKKFKIYLIRKDGETYSWLSNNMEELDHTDFLDYLKPADKDDRWIKAKDRNEAENYIMVAFQYLIEVLSVHYQTKQTHKKIIIIIDEFDAPFMNMLFSENSDQQIIGLIQQLMRLLCKSRMSAQFVQRVIIFSVTALGGMISLVQANNVKRRTFLDNDYGYYKYFGFTRKEVNALVNSCVPESQRQKALDEIAMWYNNYIVVGDKDTTISNPVSIASYLPHLVRKNYWIESVGTKYICQLFKFEQMREKVFPALRDNEKISIKTKTIELNDIHNLKSLCESILNCIKPEQVDLAFQFLTECGYFNVIDKNDGNWTLQIPNLELKQVFTDKLQEALIKFETNLFTVEQQESFVNALKSLGNGEKHEPMEYVAFKKSVENLYTDRELPKAHFHFHCDLWMLISSCGKLDCFSEFAIKKGWSPKLDLIIISKCAVIIIELKRHEQDSAKKALERCLRKKYYEAFELVGNERKGLRKILIGLHLSDDRKVSMRYLENFEKKTLQDGPNRKTIVEDSYEC